MVQPCKAMVSMTLSVHSGLSQLTPLSSKLVTANCPFPWLAPDGIITVKFWWGCKWYGLGLGYCGLYGPL